MARTRRRFISGMPHEICLRTKEGLPFPCLQFVKLLIESAMARAARAHRVTLCHYVWLANHLHLIAVVKDPADFTQFYGELAKRLTDYRKRLLGLEHLQLWEGRPMVACILDPEAVARRIEYFYTNPAKANLVESIEQYPGLSSWHSFKKASSLSSCFSTSAPRIPLGRVPLIGSRCVSTGQDKILSSSLVDHANGFDQLVVEPNAWMKCFDISENQVGSINAQIRKAIHSLESRVQKQRVKQNLKVIGVDALCSQSLSTRHSPKKRERKIFVLSSIKELRINFIQALKALNSYCQQLFRDRQLQLWPPGMFPPPMRPMASALAL